MKVLLPNDGWKLLIFNSSHVIYVYMKFFILKYIFIHTKIKNTNINNYMHIVCNINICYLNNKN